MINYLINNIWPLLIFLFFGFVSGAIFMTIMIVFVIKEGQEFISGHHIHHHGEKQEDDCN